MNVSKIEVWHDNSGKSPSWKLLRIVVEKESTDQKFVFLYNRYVSVFANS